MKRLLSAEQGGAAYFMPVTTLKDNGGGGVALALARALVDSGARVVIMSSSFHGRLPVERQENKGIEFVLTRSIGNSKVLAILLLLVSASVYSWRLRPRLIYTHIATGLIPNRHASRPLWLAQDLEYRFFTGARRRALKRLFARVARQSRIIVTSRRLGAFFRRTHRDVAFLADIGIARHMALDECPAAVRPRTIDFLMIAKRGAHKRAEETRAIAERLAHRAFNVTLVDQVGPRPDASTNTSLTLLEAVSSSEMRVLFCSSVVFLSLSKAEGYGLTPLEALAMGCRVVSTPMPSVLGNLDAALSIVRGSQDIVDRAVLMALRAHDSARLAGASSGQDRMPYAGPFTDNWARDAARAVRNLEPRATTV